MTKTMDIHASCEADLLGILRRLVNFGENNSALVIGPRGSGKTFLIRRTLLKLRAEMREKRCTNDLIVVHLAGCLQNDDKSALIEISRQLQLDNLVGGNGNGDGDSDDDDADADAADVGDENTPAVKAADKLTGSFADNFESMLRSFRAGDKQAKPLLFILDEFDLFTKNKTQLLLYTLLNTIQATASPMCLIGVTCRIDVLDLLEKRIKSRFAHRQIYVFNDYGFDTFVELARFFLADYSQYCPVPGGSVGAQPAAQLTAAQLECAQRLFEDKNVLRLLSSQYEFDKSIATVKRLMLLPAAKLADMERAATADECVQAMRAEFVRAYQLLNMDTKAALLVGISILELMLVVVMLEMSQTYVDEPFNFELIFNSYIKFLQKKNWPQLKYERPVILKAYEHLIALKFILPAGEHTLSQTRASAKMSKEHMLMYLALDKEEIESCIAQYPNCPTELTHHAHI